MDSEKAHGVTAAPLSLKNPSILLFLEDWFWPQTTPLYRGLVPCGGR